MFDSCQIPNRSKWLTTSGAVRINRHTSQVRKILVQHLSKFTNPSIVVEFATPRRKVDRGRNRVIDVFLNPSLESDSTFNIFCQRISILDLVGRNPRLNQTLSAGVYNVLIVVYIALEVSPFVSYAENGLDSRSGLSNNSEGTGGSTCPRLDRARKPPLFCIAGRNFGRRGIDFQELAKFLIRSILLPALEKPLMQSHQAKSKATILLPNLGNLLIRHIGIQRTSEKEHGAQFYNLLHIL